MLNYSSMFQDDGPSSCGSDEYWDEGKGRCVKNDNAGKEYAGGKEGGPWTSTGSGSCPAGQELSPFDASGNDASYPLECVTTAEAQRRFELRRNKNNNAGGSGSSGGGGGSSLPPIPGNPYSQQEQDLYDLYTKMYNAPGVPDPYDAAAIARLEGKLKGGAEANKAANKQAYLASRSAMGLGNTGRTGQGIRNINNAADQRTSEGMIQVNDTAIRANYDNQVANVNRKLQILEAQSQFAMALAGNAIERQRIQYNYAIQKMQLQNQLEMLKLQLVAQLGG